MNHHPKSLILLIAVFILAIAVSPVQSAGRSSVGVVTGYGMPLGWWADRWDQSLNSEMNLRFELTPGYGMVLLAGLGKSYINDLSEEEILADSHLQDVPEEFIPYTRTTEASQSGSFKQIPVGFGFYFERLIGNIRRLRGYGSVSMVVNMWKFNRSQTLTREIKGPGMTTMYPQDDWSDKKDGSDLGAQVGFGVLYQMNKFLYFEISAAYNFVDIGQKNGAIAYWGQPARTWSDDKIKSADGRADFMQLRLGFRIGS